MNCTPAHTNLALADPSEACGLMTNNMHAVGWERWLMALGIPRLFASEYGRSMEHKGLVYILRQIFYVIPP